MKLEKNAEVKTMKIKYAVTVIALGSFLLAGCSSDDSSSKEKPPSKEVKPAPEAKPTTPKEQMKDPEPPAKHTGSSKMLPQGVTKQTYKSEAEAADAIKGYEKIKQTNMDLGHGIKAFAEGAAGHQYISWNEGRWLIQVNYPSDPQYASQKEKDGKAFAVTMVNYLEKNYLPAPKDKGVLKISCFKDSPQTLIQWQKGRTVFEIKADDNKPFEAIDKAVKMGEKL